jgi:hypothetical protein
VYELMGTVERVQAVDRTVIASAINAAGFVVDVSELPTADPVAL